MLDVYHKAILLLILPVLHEYISSGFIYPTIHKINMFAFWQLGIKTDSLV